MANYKRGVPRTEGARRFWDSWTVRSRLRWQRIEGDRVREEVVLTECCAECALPLDAVERQRLAQQDITQGTTCYLCDRCHMTVWGRDFG
jgi:hypothetical protein